MTRSRTVGILIVLLIAVLIGIGFIVLRPSSENKIKEKFGMECVIGESCGDMWYIDCNSAADGPAYYVRKKTLEVFGKGGGLCMMVGQCDGPPQDWTQCVEERAR